MEVINSSQLSESDTDDENDTYDMCNFCGTCDLNYVKEPSSDPDCHISYCGKCFSIVCEECCILSDKYNDILCPECDD